MGSLLIRMGSLLIRVLVFVGVLLQAGTLLRPAVTWGQVPTTNITSSGLGTAINGSTIVPCVGGTCNITGGDRRGQNLFHSFGLFNVGGGDTANFLNDTGLATSNIVGRVNGGQTSNIFGTIRTTDFGTANLFLINPNGWIFGPTASLDVGGSFHVSTADYVRFADQSRFYADPAQNSVLTIAEPVAFGFLGPTATRISMEGSFLQVPEGQTLSVVGGDAPFHGEVETGLKITGATLAAPGGRIQIASVASAGEVRLTGGFNANSFSSLGHIDILENALIGATDADANGGGMVLIRGGSLIVDGSQILAHTLGDVEGTRLIDIQVTGDMVVSNGASISTATVTEEPAGDITVSAKNLTLMGGGNIATTDLSDLRFGVGQAAGTLTVTATDSVTISGPGSGIFSNAFSSGDANHVTLSATSLTLDDGATIFSGTFVEGRGGDIVVETENLSVTGGSTISSVAAGGGPGGGNLTLTALDSATISGPDSGIFIAGSSDAPSGNMSANFGTLTVTDSAGIQSGFILGEAGNVEIIATDAIVLSNGGGILSEAISRIGSVTILAPTLVLDNGFISTSTVGTAPAGDILLLDVGTLTLKRGGQVTSSSDLLATGDGGNLTVTANSVSISGSSPSGVPSTPFSTDPRSGLFSTASGSGAGGRISVTAGSLELTNGGTISASSSGPDTATAGNVTVIAGELVRMENSSITTEAAEAGGGAISVTTTGSLVNLTDSQITTSVRGGGGQAGNITIDSEHIVLDGSRLRADAFGGPGGNINIMADVYLTQGSLVSASSALSTPGTINIEASITDVSGTLAQLPESLLEAAALLRASCAARLAGGKTSTLVIAGREGLPLEPGDLLPSPLMAEGPPSEGLSRSEGHQWETLAAERFRLVAPSVVFDGWCSR